ncbi:2-phospho-L-lactate guanylyltransferase [Microbacterium sediminicola]|uniref:Phosphoenolpyruvate guanylyltransferase n=1 Tax=Microbacterium sediminicola TaxID=415210 RepID=A0ABP4UCM9_9MICO
MSEQITWSVVIPVRGGAGKTRLEVPGVDRAPLARAIARDTIAAARACDRVAEVIVVTGDAELARDLSGSVTIVTDPGRGLNAAVAAGADRARSAFRAALLGDLPALDPRDLSRALEAATGHERGVVADTEGTGTTLLTSRRQGRFDSAFGDGSFARHVARGHVSLTGVETLHRDVDTVDQLRDAARRGMGAHTSALLARVWPREGQGASSSVA